MRIMAAAVAFGLMATDFSCGKTWANAPGSAQTAIAQKGKSDALASHGIGPGKSDLIRLLEAGFPVGTNAGALPDAPAEKTQLAIDAMARLTQMGATEAADLMLRIASLDLPEGVNQLLSIDLSKTSPETREDFRSKALKLLQYNAINALSLLGDSRSVPLIRSAFSAESSIAARIQYALALACLGDPSGVDFLVEVISQENRRESPAAAKAFTIITNQDFGYTKNTPIRARKARAKLYRDWWKSNRSSFVCDAATVRLRKITPDTPVAFEPRSTRDLLKLSTFYFDFDNRMNTREARERLARAGQSINDDLQRIASDSMEDLDVRMEAMNWYYEVNREDAKSLLRKLRRDENPEIVEKADHLLDQMSSNNANAGLANY